MEIRCAHCGTTKRPADTIVIDWRAERICAECVAIHDWSDWDFDPITNVYRHR